MLTDVVLPQMGLEVLEGIVSALPVAAGESVEEGQTVVEVETDKAIAEVAAPRAGVVASIEVEVGETIPVGATLLRIGDTANESAGTTEEAEPSAEPTPSPPPPEPATAPRPSSSNGEAEDSANGAHRLRAAPLARRAAASLGIPLAEIVGSGPSGRITLGDVEAASADGPTDSAEAPSGSAEPAGSARPAAGSAEPVAERLEPLSATRQSIARRLGESQLVPQYTLTRDVDVAWLLAEKSRLTKSGPTKIGVVDLLIATLAETLHRHPQLAASFVPGDGKAPPQLRHPGRVDVGLAVATDRGLLVPVLRDVHSKPLPELVLERSRLIASTRAGRLGPTEMGGAATTLSSLGTFGVDSFTAMLNPGESSILAAARTVDRVVPRDRGLVVVPTMTLTFSFDHRVVDGATGAAALTELAELLEGGIEWRT